MCKTIATNVTWGNTRGMLHRLVDHLGAPFPLNPMLRAFPTPAQVAAADPALFANVIRMESKYYPVIAASCALRNLCALTNPNPIDYNSPIHFTAVQ